MSHSSRVGAERRNHIVDHPRARPHIEYVVVGHYMLQSVSHGRLFFWLTADNWDNSGPIMDLQRADVRPGTGTFVLQHKMEGPGRFHVSLYDGDQKLADAALSGSTVSPVSALIVRVGLALMAVIRKDAEAATDLYEYLEPSHRGMPVQRTI